MIAYLRINGVKAREQPVFKELARVKQYFDKIKTAEEPLLERATTLDKGAAARFIKAGLVGYQCGHARNELTFGVKSGNDKLDLERAEKQAKERARAHIKFQKLEQTEKNRILPTQEIAVPQALPASSSDISSHDDATNSAPKQKKQKLEQPSTSDSASDTQAKKISKKNGRSGEKIEGTISIDPDSISTLSKKKKSKSRREKKKSATSTTE